MFWILYYIIIKIAEIVHFGYINYSQFTLIQFSDITLFIAILQKGSLQIINRVKNT